MKIAIMSDSHDRWEELLQAITIANEKSCEYLLFAGDLISPPGIAVLEKFNGKVKFIWGNNEGEKVGITKKLSTSDKISLEGDSYEDTLDGIRIFMNHYPRIVELAAKSGEFDLCIYGHDHTYNYTKVNDTLYVNPGAITPYNIPNASFIIFDTSTKEVAKVDL